MRLSLLGKVTFLARDPGRAIEIKFPFLHQKMLSFPGQQLFLKRPLDF